MLKNLCALLIATMTVMSGCISDKDVLATFKGGEINRGEFYGWLKARRMPKSTITRKKANQKLKLKQMALDRLAFQEAKKTGFIDRKETKQVLQFISDNYLTGYYIRNIRKDSDFNEKTAKIRIIKLNVRNYNMINNKRKMLSKTDILGRMEMKMKLAKSIVDKLNSNQSFEQLAKKYSDDISKNKGGDIGYIINGMKEPGIIKAAFSLKPGEYSKEPIKIRNSIYIIKVDNIDILTKNNIDKIITDKNKLNGLKKRLQINSANNFERKLRKANDVSDMIKNANFKDDKYALFSIGSETYRVSYLKKILKFIETKKFAHGTFNKSMDDNRKKQIAKSLLRQKLILRDAADKKMNEEDDYKKNWEFIKQTSISNIFKNDYLLKGIKATDKEVEADYNRNKKRLYMRNVKTGNKTTKKVIPFEDVKQRIKFMLINRKKAVKRQMWERSILKRNSFKINESKLEGS